MSREVHVQFWERVGVKFRQRGSPRGVNTIFEQSYATAWAAIRKRAKAAFSHPYRMSPLGERVRNANTEILVSKSFQ